MIREFVIGVSKTINLGNYQSIRVEASVTMAVDPQESEAGLVVVKELAQQELRQLLEQTYRAQRKSVEGV